MIPYRDKQNLPIYDAEEAYQRTVQNTLAAQSQYLINAEMLYRHGYANPLFPAATSADVYLFPGKPMDLGVFDSMETDLPTEENVNNLL